MWALARERGLPACQGFKQDHPQRVDVCAVTVHRTCRRVERGPGHRSEAFGGHVGEGPAAIGGRGRGGGKLPVDREVEVEQQRRAIGGEQDVRRFDVAVRDSSLVSVIEPLGQAATIQARRPGIGGMAQEVADRPRGVSQAKFGRGDPVKGGNEGSARPKRRTPTFGLVPSLEDSGERRPAQKWHGDELERAVVDQVVWRISIIWSCCAGPAIAVQG